jgi:hypothetical protein
MERPIKMPFLDKKYVHTYPSGGKYISSKRAYSEQMFQFGSSTMSKVVYAR